jgi:hypothetical protein
MSLACETDLPELFERVNAKKQELHIEYLITLYHQLWQIKMESSGM